jgi:hypothetical protein
MRPLKIANSPSGFSEPFVNYAVFSVVYIKVLSSKYENNHEKI